MPKPRARQEPWTSLQRRSKAPDRATKLEALEQRLGDPIRRGVEVAASPVERGYMDGAIV